MVQLKTCTCIGKPLKYIKASEKHRYGCKSCKGCAYNIIGPWESENQAKKIGMKPLRNFFNGKKIRCR